MTVPPCLWNWRLKCRYHENYEDYFAVMIGLVQGVVTSLFESWTLSAFLHHIDYPLLNPSNYLGTWWLSVLVWLKCINSFRIYCQEWDSLSCNRSTGIIISHRLIYRFCVSSSWRMSAIFTMAENLAPLSCLQSWRLLASMGPCVVWKLLAWRVCLHIQFTKLHWIWTPNETVIISFNLFWH
jgi:hypothetical protein